MKSNEIRLIHHEHIYQRPNVPSDEKEILFHDYKKEDQFWRRPRVKTDAEFSDLSAQQKFTLIERERERHQNGLWFMNNGTPEYMTGMHYDHLVYQTFDYVPKFLVSQQHDFYFKELLHNDKKTYGGIIIKPRRYGYTDSEVTAHQYRATNNFNVSTGMMSDTREKVYTTIFNKIIDSHIRRPEYMRANLYMRNGDTPKKKAFYKSSKGIIAESMFSRIEPKATTVMGYDGDKIKYMTLDEIWKWIKVSPIKCWDKQKKCLFDGGTVIGKAMLLSTMGDDESYDQAIKDGIQMWHDSNPFERDDNGFTNTGLYRYFVPGYYALFGNETGFLNRYGEINIDQATVYIENERKKYEAGSMDWTFEVRRYPLTIEEALGSALTEGTFDKKRLTERIEIINKLPASEKPYTEGILIEDNNKRVHFEPQKDGIWLVHKLPLISLEKKIDKSNRWKEFDEKILAPRNPEGIVGYDPTRYLTTQTTSTSISKASIMAKYKFDYFRQGPDSAAGKRAGWCLERFDNPEDGHMNALMACKFWGFKLSYERQVESMLRLAIELKMTDFIMHGQHGKYGWWTDTQVWKDGLSLLRKRWSKPTQPFQRDYLAEEPFAEHLGQAKDFNPKQLTIFDAIVSDIMVEKGFLNLYESNLDHEEDYDAGWAAITNAIFTVRR